LQQDAPANKVCGTLNSKAISRRIWTITEENNFYLGIENSKQYLEACFKILPEEWRFNPTLEKLLTGFLFNNDRNKQVFTPM